MLLYPKTIETRLFHYKIIFFLEKFARCFEQASHHQAKLLQIYKKDSRINISVLSIVNLDRRHPTVQLRNPVVFL